MKRREEMMKPVPKKESLKPTIPSAPEKTIDLHELYGGISAISYANNDEKAYTVEN